MARRNPPLWRRTLTIGVPRRTHRTAPPEANNDDSHNPGPEHGLACRRRHQSSHHPRRERSAAGRPTRRAALRDGVGRSDGGAGATGALRGPGRMDDRAPWWRRGLLRALTRAASLGQLLRQAHLSRPRARRRRRRRPPTPADPDPRSLHRRQPVVLRQQLGLRTGPRNAAGGADSATRRRRRHPLPDLHRAGTVGGVVAGPQSGHQLTRPGAQVPVLVRGNRDHGGEPARGPRLVLRLALLL